MSKTKLRWFIALLMVFALVLAACQPAATPTPTPRPTEPPTEVQEEEPVTEATEAAAEEAATEEGEEVAMAGTPAAETETPEVAEVVTLEATAVVEEVVEVAATAIVEVPATEIVTAVATEIVEVVTTEIVETTATEIVTVEATVEVSGVVTGEATAVVMEPTAAPTEELGALETEVPGAEATSVAGGLANAVTVSEGEQVIIGLAAGLSGEGIAPLGIDIQRGAEIAIARRGTVTVDGQEFPVRLDAQDDQCSAEGGQAVANRFVSNENVVAVVGPMCSSACRAAAPIFDSADFTTISPSCTAADLTTSGFSSFNRSVVSDAFQGRVTADFIYNVLGVRSIATIHDGSTYGEGLVTVLTNRFEELGGEVVAADAVNVGDTDFRGLLEDIAQDDPDLIYFGGFPAEAARLAIQRADAGLEDTLFMGADGINGTEFIELAGDAAEGAYASKAIPASSDELDAFLAEYEDTYGEQPPAPYHGTAYDAVNVLLDAVEAVGTVQDGELVIDRDALAEYVRSVEDFQGLTGVLNADGTGEMSFTDIGIDQVQNGAFVRMYVGRVVDGETQLEEATATPAAEQATEEAGADGAATEEAAEPEAEATSES